MSNCVLSLVVIYAVKWTPLSEPAPMLLLLLGLVIAAAARRGVRRLLLRACCVCCVLAIQGAAWGQTTNWTGPINGRWDTASYWSAGVPTPSKDAVIANGGAATVSDVGCPIQGVCYDEAKSVTVGSGHNGGLNVIQSGMLFVDNNLSVGDLAGIGEVDLFDNGQIGSKSGHIGGTFGGSGTVNLDNSSYWTNTAELVVGDSGTGTLNVHSQSTVQNDVGDVGLASGSHGTANVDGRDTTWTNNSVLAVGVYGAGVLHVNNGASVSSSLGRIGREFGSSGAVTVDGFASNGTSNWYMTGDLTVGGAGNGTLGISNRGYVSNAIGTIGTSASSTSMAVVTGSGSTWANSGDVVVGQAGNGTLEVRDGGKVSSVRGHVAFNTGATGSVLVSDPGSTWTASGSHFIGNGGSGSLQVLNGATASTSGNSYLGFSPGASGSAVVSGAGSTWNTAGQLIVGGNLATAGGVGYLRVDDGGVVSVTGGITIRSTGQLVGNATIMANVVNEGDVAPGDSPGTIHVTGNYNQSPSGILEMQIAGTDDASYDHLIVDGSATIGGQLVLQLIDGFVPQAGDEFDLLHVIGAFDETANVSFTGVADGWQFSQAFDPATGMVVLTSLNNATPIVGPGDFNADRIVDAADYVVWRNGLDTAYTQDDYNTWQANFGQTAGSGAGLGSSNGSVPEPSSILLLFALAIIGLLFQTRSHVRINLRIGAATMSSSVAVTAPVATNSANGTASRSTGTWVAAGVPSTDGAGKRIFNEAGGTQPSAA